jgi:hypothetical protein
MVNFHPPCRNVDGKHRRKYQTCSSNLDRIVLDDRIVFHQKIGHYMNCSVAVLYNFIVTKIESQLPQYL